MAVTTGRTGSAKVQDGRQIIDRLVRSRRGALLGRERRVKLKQLAGALAFSGGGRAEKTIAADLLKAFGQDVLEKARDEGVDGKGEVPGLVCARAGIAEGDAAVIQGFDAVIGDGDTMDIAGEVLGGVLA